MIDVVSKSILFAIMIVLAVAGGFMYWQFYLAPEPYIPPIRSHISLYTAPYAHASLGENIYTKSQNPIEDKVPTAPSPNINPIAGTYKNPFE